MPCGTQTRSLLLIAVALAMMISRANAQTSPGRPFPEQAIVLPLELVAGQPATLAVLAPDGRVAAGVTLVLSSGEVVTTDASGRAHFLAPPDAGIMIARIPGTETRAAADVVQRSLGENLEISGVPDLAVLKDRFVIYGGGFQGDADRNQVEIGGQAALVLAASPIELVILASPRTAPGTLRLAVKSGTGEVSTQITLVNAVADSIPGGVGPGRTAKIIVHVRGTTQPVGLKVRNVTPGIVQFKHGDIENLQTQGGPNNSVTLEVKGERAGEFSYTVALASRFGPPNIAVARDFLKAAEQIATGKQKSRIESVLKKLRPRTVRVPQARKEFAKLPSAGPPSDFVALIRAAGEALNGQ